MAKEKRATSRATILIFLIIFVLFGVVYIWNSFVVDKKIDELIRLERKLEQLKIEKLHLESEYEKLTSVGYVARFAEKQLGLVFPKGELKEIEISKDELGGQK